MRNFLLVSILFSRLTSGLFTYFKKILADSGPKPAKWLLKSNYRSDVSIIRWYFFYIFDIFIHFFISILSQFCQSHSSTMLLIAYKMQYKYWFDVTIGGVFNSFLTLHANDILFSLRKLYTFFIKPSGFSYFYCISKSVI